MRVSITLVCVAFRWVFHSWTSQRCLMIVEATTVTKWVQQCSLDWNRGNAFKTMSGTIVIHHHRDNSFPTETNWKAQPMCRFSTYLRGDGHSWNFLPCFSFLHSLLVSSNNSQKSMEATIRANMYNLPVQKHDFMICHVTKNISSTCRNFCGSTKPNFG